jgi:hypothetical protein
MTRLDELKKLAIEYNHAFNLPVAKGFADIDSKHIPAAANSLAELYQEYSKAKLRSEIALTLTGLLYGFLGVVVTTGIDPLDYNALPVLTQTEVLNKMLFPGDVVLMIRALQERIPCYRKLLTAETQLYWKIERAAWNLGIDILTAVKLFHKSAMTILWTEGEVRNIKDTSDLFAVSASRTQGRFVVKRKSDNKFINSPGYLPIDFSSL